MKRAERADLIAGLNNDLAHEYAAVIQYRTFASVVRGPYRLILGPLFAGEIADELTHAGLLADAIVALGGTPTVQPAPVLVVEGPAEMLRHVVEAERAALASYVERRQQAGALGEPGLAVALDSVIADETRHRDELQLVLAGWTETAADQGIAAGDLRRRPSRSAAEDQSIADVSRHVPTDQRTDQGDDSMRASSDDMRDGPLAPSDVAQTASLGREHGGDVGRRPVAREQPLDRVFDASVDSFPASDAPSWTGMRVGPPRRGRGGGAGLPRPRAGERSRARRRAG